MLINVGTQERMLSESPSAAGSLSKHGSIRSDSLVATLWVNSSAGTLTITVFTLTDEGKEVELFHFPDIVAGTTNLLLKKSGVSLQRFRIQSNYSGACDYEVYIRAVQGLGESSTRILGASDWRVTQQDVGTVAVVLIAASLEDRNGVLVKNWDDTGTLYIAETLLKATAGDGYPLAPKDALAMDIAAGATVYAIGDEPVVDVRIAESGG